MPRALTYGTHKSQGLDVHYILITQLIFHLWIYMKHIENDTPTGDLLRERTEALQLELGTKEPFWELDFETY